MDDLKIEVNFPKFHLSLLLDTLVLTLPSLYHPRGQSIYWIDPAGNTYFTDYTLKGIALFLHNPT